jgi:hypothetical protein
MLAWCSQIGIKCLVVCDQRLAQLADAPHLALLDDAPRFALTFSRKKAFLRPQVSCLKKQSDGSGCESLFSLSY